MTTRNAGQNEDYTDFLTPVMQNEQLTQDIYKAMQMPDLSERHDAIKTLITQAHKQERQIAANAVLRRTRIPKDAKNPTRDWLVVWGEQMAEIILSAPHPTHE